MLTDLKTECVYFVELLFAESAADWNDGWIVETYVQAHQPHQMQLSSKLRWAVQKKWDLNSVEFFLRLKNPKNALSQKIATVIYLCEMHPRFNRFFESKQQFSIGSVLVQFLKFGIFAAGRFLKGAFLYALLTIRNAK